MTKYVIKSGCSFMAIIYLIILIPYIMAGAWSVSLILSWFNITALPIVSYVLGFFLGEFSIPIVLVGKLLQFFGSF